MLNSKAFWLVSSVGDGSDIFYWKIFDWALRACVRFGKLIENMFWSRVSGTLGPVVAKAESVDSLESILRTFLEYWASVIVESNLNRRWRRRT